MGSSSSVKCGLCLPEISIEDPKFTVTHTVGGTQYFPVTPPTISFSTSRDGLVCLFTATIKICDIKCEDAIIFDDMPTMIPNITLERVTEEGATTRPIDDRGQPIPLGPEDDPDLPPIAPTPHTDADNPPIVRPPGTYNPFNRPLTYHAIPLPVWEEMMARDPNWWGTHPSGPSTGFTFDLHLPEDPFLFTCYYYGLGPTGNPHPSAVRGHRAVDVPGSNEPWLCANWKKFCCDGTKDNKSSSLTGLGPTIESQGAGGSRKSSDDCIPCCDQLLNAMKKDEACLTIPIDCPFTIWDSDFGVLSGRIEYTMGDNVTPAQGNPYSNLQTILNREGMRQGIARAILQCIGDSVGAAMRQGYSDALEKDPTDPIQDCYCEEGDDSHCCGESPGLLG